MIFSYPLDKALILRKYKALKREILANGRDFCQASAILANEREFLANDATTSHANADKTTTNNTNTNKTTSQTNANTNETETSHATTNETATNNTNTTTANKTETFISKKIAILGGSTTALLKDLLELFLLDLGIKAQFYESDYNKFYEDALFGNAILDAFKPDIIYIHTSFYNLNFPHLNESGEKAKALLDEQMAKFQGIWQALSEKFKCLIIQNNFDYPPFNALGDLDAYDERGKTHFINALNLEFAKAASTNSTLYLHDIAKLSAAVGLKEWHDLTLYCTAKYAMSYSGLCEMGFNLSRLMGAIFGKSKKALVLDLDNTLWGGIIGDDGLAGIKIGTETPEAQSFSLFQSYVKELKNRGVILAVCSKNDEKNAKEGFTHASSVLKMEDFSCFKANWLNKDENIKNIAKELNIGLDSLVFVDDNPLERDLVRTNCPSVAVVEANSPLDFITHIDKNGFFEAASLSKDDLERNKFYADNAKRQSEQGTFASYDEFLQALNMKAIIKPFEPLYFERIAALVNKTNQFNLTTQRYTQAQLEAFARDEKYLSLYAKLADKYGDNGLVAVSLGEIENELCHIKLWLMSCRVLKRGLEFAMLDSFVEMAKKRGVKRLVGHYKKSPKNAMVATLYGDFGFELLSSDDENSVWGLDLKGYKRQNKFIVIE